MLVALGAIRLHGVIKTLMTKMTIVGEVEGKFGNETRHVPAEWTSASVVTMTE